VKPVWLLGGLAIAAYLIARRRRLGTETLVVGALAAAAGLAVGTGLVELPNIEKLIEDVGQALGKWTYLLVGGLAFLETGAFVGLVAPGETAVLVGGVVAAQGEIDLMILIALVWACAVAGDLTSYTLGRRLGRQFLVRHGPRVKITEERLETVEVFFAKYGGATIFIGRFLGLVRALAPFIAGASRMPLRRFLPYDVLGAGLWATTFCVLGYVFWRSLDRVTQYVGRGVFLLGTLIALVVAVMFVRRLMRDPEFKARTKARIKQEGERPWLRPIAVRAIPAYRRFGRPLLRRLLGPARFVWGRITPGQLGLELTTMLAIAAVGTFTLFFLGGLISPHRPELPLDQTAFEIGDRVYDPFVADIVKVVTTFGTLAVTLTVSLLVSIWAISRRRVIEAVALPVSLLITSALVSAAKETEGRGRPLNPHVETMSDAYPSGHAAYAVAYVACAVVLVRAGSGLAIRFAAVTVAIVLCVVIALSRVYLRAHYISDVVGGVALALAVYALCGVIALVIAHVRDNEAS
jgi:membrane protein DedA with SNARE-associated domain/membrane-associated phospholipid phosphatase